MTEFSLPRNAFKAKLAARKDPVLGLWLMLGADASTELLADAGFDYVLIDGEHAPLDIDLMRRQIAAAERGASSVVARPPVNEAWVLKQLLDAGAQSFIIPMVDTAEQAEAAVQACHYPPRGIRGAAGVVRAARYGRIPGYLTKANAEICVVPQVETLTAVENIEAICAVDGVDAIFIGPSDLSASMGFTGQPGAPEVDEVIRSSIARIHACGKPACTLGFDEATVAKYLEMGADMVAVGSDVTLLLRGAAALLAKHR
ncbi:HpcH/HpaI aldolase/citrate lyase family protein [Albimonas sp. CAU 1670]|uniref:HpcH/HpaI aldolase family protein n=1 Tax=Albimonas sp. CAU 1670 TaxID=3032599 RepID=UPI0023DAA5C0|nr:HpcH/HpaI aldolase/citrate lyase family protein [Albimonas sp. CAU 1670]MDF2233399.1 HpcH/HpaI aldolase/citrate lyase family protein [Albimonas sp. CAU 1670]